MKKDVPVAIRIPKELDDKIEAIAYKLGTTKSDFIRKSVLKVANIADDDFLSEFFSYMKKEGF